MMDAKRSKQAEMEEMGDGRRDSGDTGSGSTIGKSGKHIVNAVKGFALWQMGKGVEGKENLSSSGDGESVENDGMNGSHVLRMQVRKKWDDVRSRLGGNTSKAERFVLKERPEASDFGESNDRYFQELMTGGS